jgi:predicted glutamine amidotransferase
MLIEMDTSFFFLKRQAIISKKSFETRALLELKAAQNEEAILIAGEELTSDEDWKLMENNTLLVCDDTLNYEIIKI